MEKRVMMFLLISTLMISLLFTFSVFAVTNPGTIHGITIGDMNFTCGASDSICPSDYANCSSCVIDSGSGDVIIDDPDCCVANSCGWGCTDAGVVCGDSTNEIWKDETDSSGNTITSSSVEDCNGSCSSGTENVIDTENDAACVDSYYNGTFQGYTSSDNCADDGIIYMPYTATSNLCSQDRSCHDTDDDGDNEVCAAGNWHDADESETYCTATGGVWTTGTGTDSFRDDYDNDLTNGYCEGDDGYQVTGAIVQETYRTSNYCDAAEDVTVSIKDLTDPTRVYDTDTTSYSSTWSETVNCHEQSSDNFVGRFTVTLAPGTYYLVAEKDGLNTVTKTIDLSSMTSDQALTYFEMYYNDECQSDCTKNDRICYASCEGINDCAYSSYEATSIANYCDGREKGYRYALSQETDQISNSIYGYEVYCCDGSAQFYTRDYFSSDDAEINCVENLISRDKGFIVNGERLNLHFVLFSDPHPEKPDCSIYSDFACETYGDAFC